LIPKNHYYKKKTKKITSKTIPDIPELGSRMNSAIILSNTVVSGHHYQKEKNGEVLFHLQKQYYFFFHTCDMAGTGIMGSH
jgi:hypothetical protein